MKKSLFFILLSALVICASCGSRWSIKDETGALGKTTGPVANTFRLSQKQVAAAHEGRLGLTEQTTNKLTENIIPVQWEFSESGAKPVAVMLLPAGEPGRRRFDWLETKTKSGNTMQAAQDQESGQINISDDGKPVLRYNYKTVYERDALDTLAANNYIVTANDTFMANPSIYAVPRSNYIHPVYGPGGELLTRDWSRDHPHHRGIYWAWPEVDFGSKRGDLHALQIVFARPTGKIKLQNGPVFAQIEAENLWMWKDSVPIVNEVAVIRAYRSTARGRVIDLAFRFIALKDSITIARRDTKLYGGLSIRMQTPKLQEISVFSDSSNLLPVRAWSDLSGIFAGAESPSGLTVLQDQQNPDYPGDWIQYPELSWCQPTFPASGTRYTLSRGKPLVLYYRLLVHQGTKPDHDLSSMLWDAFNAEAAPQIKFSLPEPHQEK
jgi:hypothetical protein